MRDSQYEADPQLVYDNKYGFYRSKNIRRVPEKDAKTQVVRKIEFMLRNPENICRKDEKFGCCCTCVFHAAVNAHCSHFPHKEGECVCNEFLGFYVCTLFQDETGQVNLSGRHSPGCECHTPRKTSPKLSGVASAH